MIDGISWFMRFALMAGALLAMGHVMVGIVFRRQAPLAIPALLVIGAACGGFMMQGAALTGTLAGALDATMLGLLWSTVQGTALALHVVGAGLILLGVALRLRVLHLGGAAVLLSGFATIGHVADAPGVWLSVVLLAHLMLAAFWVGVLWPLDRLAVQDPVAAARMGAQFGRIAIWSVPVLIGLGIVMAFFLLDSIGQIWSTRYGLALMAKTAVVAAMLALGAMNKMRHVPALRAGRPGAARALQQSVRAEGLAAVLVLAATASFSTVAGLP